MIARRKIKELIADGTILALQDGNHGEKHPTTADYVDDGIPFLMARDFRDGQIHLSDACKIPKSLGDSLRIGFARTGDVLLTHKGTVGLVAIVPPVPDYVMLTPQVTYYRTNPEKLLNVYLKYAFQAPFFRDQLTSFSAQSTRPYIGITAQKELQIDFPPLPIQRRIASILSAYDELIENSQRRIRILESMARALYREWFVHFRFPGHESVPRVPSPLGEIPKGWDVTELTKVCADDKGIQTGPFGSQLHESDYSDEGVPVVMPKDLIDFRIRTDSIARIPEATAEKLGRHRMQPGDIVYGRRGDIGRRAFVMSHQTGWFCGTGCLRIRPNPRKVDGWFLFNYLGQDDVVSLIQGRAQGVTMPNLNTGVLSSLPVRLPPRKLQDDFTSLTFPIAETHECLSAKIENLRHTRDLLLPRLLSGQIDVEALDYA